MKYTSILDIKHPPASSIKNDCARGSYHPPVLVWVDEVVIVLWSLTVSCTTSAFLTKRTSLCLVKIVPLALYAPSAELSASPGTNELLGLSVNLTIDSPVFHLGLESSVGSGIKILALKLPLSSAIRCFLVTVAVAPLVTPAITSPSKR